MPARRHRGSTHALPSHALPRENPAIRDAQEVFRRTAADEASAADARARYRTSPICPLPADQRIARFLRPDEETLAVRRSAALERRAPLPPGSVTPALGGDLYLTSERLLLVGRHIVAFELADIEDAVVSGDQLCLALRNGTDVRLDVQQPRLLRVEIAAARSSR